MKFFIFAVMSLCVSLPAFSQTNKVAVASNQFAFDLYRLNSEQAGNIFFSPLSIQAALAMTSAGAQKDTLDQMIKTMHWSPGYHLEFKKLLGPLKGQKEFQLSIANRLWSSVGQTYEPSFLKNLSANYLAEPASLDFKKQPEPSRQTINQWVEQQTQKKIKDLLPQGSITPLTDLVLTNAIYFKGTWSEPFKKANTKPGDFSVSEREKKSVPFMHLVSGFKYAANDQLQLLEMEYKGQQLVMDILLPSSNIKLSELEKKMNPKMFSDLISSLQYDRVDVTLPKFKTEFHLDLEESLKKLGMVLPFDRTQANFHGIRKLRPGENLYISKVIHKAFVDVNEEGTEAAAATAVVMLIAESVPPPPKVFKADRPFLFMIRHIPSGAILFLGRYLQP